SGRLGEVRQGRIRSRRDRLMARAALHSLVCYLRRLAAPAEPGEDAALLRRFTGQGDEPAFAALVQRHGPMVWSVCARMLPDAAEAEDAFQATFLVLLRKAASLRRPDRLGPWLHGVACRAAAKARARAARRAARERSAPARLADE